MIHRLEKAINIIGAVLLLALMLFTVIDVLGRNFLNRPLVGAVELSELSLALIVFLLLPSISLRREHITLDLIDSFAGRFLNLLRDVLVLVIGVTFFAIMAWNMWDVAGESASYKDATPSLGIPVAPFHYVIAVLAGLCSAVYVWNCFSAMKRRNESSENELSGSMMTVEE